MYNNINIYFIFYIKNITLKRSYFSVRFKYELGIGFHHIHYFLEHFDLKLFKISPKNRHNEGLKHLKKPKSSY
jgi:hypothetical protein